MHTQVFQILFQDTPSNLDNVLYCKWCIYLHRLSSQLALSNSYYVTNLQYHNLLMDLSCEILVSWIRLLSSGWRLSIRDYKHPLGKGLEHFHSMVCSNHPNGDYMYISDIHIEWQLWCSWWKAMISVPLGQSRCAVLTNIFLRIQTIYKHTFDDTQQLATDIIYMTHVLHVYE